MNNEAVEKSIEDYLRKQIEKIGGKAYKLISPGNSGVPDRIVCLPKGKVIFVETKRPKGGVLSALQIFRHRELRKIGQRVEVLNTKEKIDEFIEREITQ